MTILAINQLEKRTQNTVLFSAFDLEVKKGETVAVQCNSEIGNNLIRILIREISPSGGNIKFHQLKDERQQALFQHIGLSLQSDSLYDRLTVREYLNFFKSLYDVQADVEDLLLKVGLVEKERIRTEKLTFSEKKRLHIARVILHNPDLIIMEDPAQNLDMESSLILHRLIAELEEQGKAIFLTTSNLETAISLTDNVFRLDDSGIKRMEVTEENNEAPIEETEITDMKTEEEAVSEHSLQIRFDKIPAKVDDKLILFDPTEIDYIESNSGVSHLHVKGESFPCTFTLSDLHERLQPFGFFRCHRSYIVNLQKVREVITWTRNSYSLNLDDQKKSSIPLAKGKLDELKNIIGI